MAKTFDSTLKQLIDKYATDWAGFLLAQLGLPAGCAAEVLDADLSTFTLEADKLFHFSGPASGLIHLELEGRWDDDLPGRLLLYNVLAEHRHGGPVHSVVVQLRRAANSSAVTGLVQRRFASGATYHVFRYTVIRLWELPCEALLAGDLGVVPLALLTDDAQPRLPELIGRIEERLDHEQFGPSKSGEFWTACSILLGMRLEPATIRRLFEGVKGMLESSFYNAIIEEGGVKALRRAVLRAGRERFGPPSAEQESALIGIEDPDRLERFVVRLNQAADWNDLLNTP